MYGSIAPVSSLTSNNTAPSLILCSHIPHHRNTFLHVPKPELCDLFTSSFFIDLSHLFCLFAVRLWPQLSVFQAPFTPAVLCIWKSRVKQGCPLHTHTFASTLYLPEGATSLSGGFLISQHFVLIFPSSALTQGVKSIVTAIITSISVAASVLLSLGLILTFF